MTKPIKIRTIFISKVIKNLKLLDINASYFSKNLSISEGFFREVLKGKRNLSLDNCNEITDKIKEISKIKKIDIDENYFID